MLRRFSRRSFVKGSAVAGVAVLADASNAGAVPGAEHPPRIKQFWPVPPTPTPAVVGMPPQPYRTAIGWAGGTFTYDEARACLKHHGADLGALDQDLTLKDAHYSFSHFDEAVIDPQRYQLSIGGNVSKPMTLGLADLQARPNVTETVLLECAGNGRAALDPRPRYIPTPWFQEAFGVARYVGTPLASLLEEAGIRPGSVEVVFSGADQGVEQLISHNYQRSLIIADALDPEVLVAWEANGEPLSQAHGAPVRLVVPHWYGMASVKWLVGIEVVTKPFRGFQQYRSYRYTDSDPFRDPGLPVQRINVRAAMKPPGVADVDTAARWLPAGPTTLVGKAWSGHGRIVRVEVSTNVGETWRDAALGVPVSSQSWTPWSFPWYAAKGNYVVAVRATDSAGHRQPMHPRWNYLGVGINAIELSRVIVT